MTENNLGILTNIKVEGFKSIKEINLPLKPLNIIVGPNGVGKSNFIGVFKLLYKIVSLDLQKYVLSCGGAERFFHFGSKNTDKIKIELGFKCNTYRAILEHAIPDTLVFAQEMAFYGEWGSSIENKGGLESKLKSSNEYKVVYTERYLHGFRVYHFHDTSDSALIKKNCSISNQSFLQANGENLAAMLYRFKEYYKEDYDNIVNVIKMVAPFFQDFILEPDDAGNIMLKWKQYGSDTVFDANYLSDGTLRFMALSTLLLQPDQFIPSTVLIDEPELGLHPYALKVLAEQMKRVAARGKQIVATSQSVTFINEFSYEDIVVADRQKEQSVFRRLEENEVKNWLDEFAMGDIWEKNIIGGTPDEF